jgi:RNA polymerase sigma-70 factor (ECF subfamily)
LGDQEIFEALKGGQMEAFDQIYKMHRTEFIYAATSKFRAVPQDDIIDAWQDAVISFYEQIRDGRLLNLSCSIRSFIFLLGFRYIIKYKRRHLKEADIQPLEEKGIPDLTHIDLDWESRSQENLNQLHIAVNQLPEQSRRILSMRFFECKTVDEIRSIMNYNSTNAVSVTLSRALVKLKELLEYKN